MTDNEKDNAQTNQYVSFVLCGEEYGIPILCVQEIIRYDTLTKIPQSPEYVVGVLNLRGQVIPVVNLRMKFGLEDRELDKSTRIIVVEVQGRIMGMVVDEVSEVLQIELDNISPPPPMGTQLRTDYISGMAKIKDTLVILLEIDKILTTEESVILEQASSSSSA